MGIKIAFYDKIIEVTQEQLDKMLKEKPNKEFLNECKEISQKIFNKKEA